jgi:hypothetical protein
MKRLIALSLVTLMAAAGLAAAPALGEPTRKTELVELDGKSVDTMQLRHAIDATWVVDNQNILYRDTSRDYYLVTLKEACRQLEVRRSFDFFPAVSWELREDRTYEVRPQAGPHCGVARIAQVDDARADALRDASLRRAW